MVPIPLLRINISVEIQSIIAETTVQQHFVNIEKVPIAVTYVFPVNANSAIYDLTIQSGNKTIVAKVVEKAEA
eukprot:CAMPEP_0201285800 /NCGR_PEP_ID=MMETSP1317-20130820/113840_1 /ASSEMBLY_ACC=CAM_ASM_000770 /TAXON_ID=187299 /ORGANISM="Undescribed Undescribed, Strain Undescribed" /LENGTH=72 /DNA_ID=CAMNT_0047611767 /DNA_START=220 /DNA_END=438 /DNA_ORIENTATION=+